MAKKSYRQLERDNKALMQALDRTINDISHETTKTVALSQILEGAIEDFIKGNVTKFEMQQWYLKWKSNKNNTELTGEQIAETLGLEDLPEQFKQLELEVFASLRAVYNQYFEDLRK